MITAKFSMTAVFTAPTLSRRSMARALLASSSGVSSAAP